MIINELIEKARSEDRRFLMEDEAKKIMAARGIPVAPCLVAHSEQEAVVQAEKIGYPVVLKIRSSKIVHKTESSGVHLDLYGEEAVRTAYREILEKAASLDPQATVTVQPMAEKGIETLIGTTVDRQFGPVVAFGLGGVFVEVLEDVSFRMAPVDIGEAGRMIRQIKGYRLLQEYRSSPAVDTGALAGIIAAVSRLAVEFNEIAEIDLNPVAAYQSGAVALDARVVLRSQGQSKNKPERSAF